ncbi:MAG TPA: TerB family tellurite resistance protein [Candidatus Polarisedimenticolaceae bacterium]|nr:TerB family tellurite resistance protein [Candidatus Polarisedimenticolaceae bacterium]
MSILRWLGLQQSTPVPPGDTESVRKIAAALDGMDEAKARYIAAFAYVLSRVAGADMEISAAETATMERLVREKAGFGEAEAVLVVQIAKAQHRLFSGSENFLVTREFGRLASREDKLALVDALFAVSSADESILHREDAEIGKIASELGLDHGDFIAVKSRYRQYLEVLKPESPE